MHRVEVDELTELLSSYFNEEDVDSYSGHKPVAITENS